MAPSISMHTSDGRWTHERDGKRYKILNLEDTTNSRSVRVSSWNIA